MSFAVGTLVKTRGREWIVLPNSSDNLLMLRPLGGTQEEETGVYLPLEKVAPATFEPPDPNDVGDHRSCRLLRDAVRLGFRASTGPFRSFAGLAVEPRPYQLVPLLMALKLEPVRLLIADDVGIGKTVESLLIAKELLARDEVNSMAVLCPPHLGEQWQSEMREKFHIDAELVLPSTAARLERQCLRGESVFHRFPFTIVSTDYIKSDRRRDDFLRACPELVIVDEAHTCVDSGGSGGHQRHRLIKGLADDSERHLILVTATPHSGKEDAFRELLALLNPDFASLPNELGGKENEKHRRRLAQYFVQRRRHHIVNYLDTDTPFPKREEAEMTYKHQKAYRDFFDEVLAYAREIVRDESGGKNRQRIRWWSALALLRAVGSSPAAAAATLRNRALAVEEEDAERVDALGRRSLYDLTEEEGTDGNDVLPGSDFTIPELALDGRIRARLPELAAQADALGGKQDQKLLDITRELKALLKAGRQPILFCRFIPTAEYLAEELRGLLGKKVEVISVTGLLPPAEREARVRALSQHKQRVLVCTDCLSEGINLQELFDSVIHYDLSWNPTRHEQREGRVDRFGQPQPTIRILTYYGENNPVDGLVLEVLLRKHKTIRTSLGISVPVPGDPNAVVEALMEGLLFKGDGGTGSGQLYLGFMHDPEELHAKWQLSGDREKISRTLFAQHTISPDEVARELKESQEALGAGLDVSRFVQDAVLSLGGGLAERPDGAYKLNLKEVPRGLKDQLNEETVIGRFKLPLADPKEQLLGRTHPLVENLAAYLFDTALDVCTDGIAKRCGAIRTSAVRKRTTLLLVRLRCHIVRKASNRDSRLLAEECRLLAFEGSPENASWLPDDQAEALLQATPSATIPNPTKSSFVQKVVDGLPQLEKHLDEFAERRGTELLESHLRVRNASRQKGVKFQVHAQTPIDLLGIYVYLPDGV